MAEPTPRRTSVVDVGTRVTSRLPQGKLRIELLTDPWSVWCWGFEPVRRALVLRHPDLEFRFLVGGMFEEMPRPDQIGFDVDRFFGIVQRTTGMPIRADGPRRDPPTSTYPACIHVHTVRLIAPELEDAYLRALREAVYLDGLNISRDEVGADVAERVGIPRARFLEARRSGQPEAVFKDTVAKLQAKDLHGYPTVLFTLDEGEDVQIRGYLDRLAQPEPGVYEIHDYKTSRRLPSQADVDQDRQLGLYQLAIQTRHPDAREVRLVWHFVAHNRKFVSHRNSGALERLKRETLAVVARIANATEANDFPAKRSRLCDWCDYRAVCPEWNPVQESLLLGEERA